MSNEEWNELQSKVFAKAFEQVEDGVSTKCVIASLEFVAITVIFLRSIGFLPIG